jgi:hypothetical protein
MWYRLLNVSKPADASWFWDVDATSSATNTRINNWVKQQPGFVQHIYTPVDSNNATLRQIWATQQDLETMFTARVSNPDWLAKAAYEASVGITRTVVSQGVVTE